MIAEWSALLFLVGAAAALTEQPNIVFIMADDLGWNDVGFESESEVSTPSLKLLAEEGVILNQYYTQHISTASRAAFMSGRLPIKLGLQHGVISPDQPNCLPLEVFTIAEKLQSLGYITRGLGKWHLGFYKEACMPTNRGFDSYLGSMGGAQDYFNHTHCVHGDCGYDLKDGLENAKKHNGTYSTHLYRDEAIKIIENHAQSEQHHPLFLYLAFQSAHGPLQVPANYAEAYASVRNPTRRTHAAVVAAMDQAIGNIRMKLKDAGMWDNTVVIFTTDNGASYKKGGSNWPLRGHKGSLFEGAVRGVSLVSSPLLGDQQGTVNNELLHITDWYPTLAGLALGNCNELEIDGKDIWSVISNGEPSQRTALLLNMDPLHPRVGVSMYPNIFDTRIHAALRFGDFKILTGDQGPGYATDSSGMSFHFKVDNSSKNLWLFNVKTDAVELMDLSEQDIHYDTVERLLTELRFYYDFQMEPPIFPAKDPKSHPSNFKGYWMPWQ